MFMKKVEVEAKIEIALCRNKVKHVLVVLVRVSTDCFKNAYWVATGATLWFLVNC